MTKEPSPSVRRLQLGAMLRKFRTDAGQTTQDAADWLGIGDSAVSKIEKGRTAIKAQTVRSLGQLYEIDADKLNHLLQMVRESNQRGWLAAYRGTVPQWFRQYAELESDAADIWNYEPEFVPGQLQTAEYVRALYRANRPDMDADEIERQIELRRERQERTSGAHPPRFHLFINEAVIRRPVGDTETWRAQIERLIESSQLLHITLRVVPFSVGPHPAMSGGFVMMQFPEDTVPAFVYEESQRGGLYQDDPGDIDRYTGTIDGLVRVSLSPEETREILAQVANETAK